MNKRDSEKWIANMDKWIANQKKKQDKMADETIKEYKDYISKSSLAAS